MPTRVRALLERARGIHFAAAETAQDVHIGQGDLLFVAESAKVRTRSKSLVHLADKLAAARRFPSHEVALAAAKEGAGIVRVPSW